MQLFVILLVVVGTICGAIVVAVLKIQSAKSRKKLQPIMNELRISFTPIGPESFWKQRDWDDTLFLSGIEEVSGHLSSFEGASVEEKLASSLEKMRKKQTNFEEGSIVVNGIKWVYEIPTYKVEGGRVIRSFTAATGNGTVGLQFEVSLGTPGTIPQENLGELLSCFTLIQ